MKHARAFTLVELLVVIGIIAVLIAILLPALMSVRKHALKISCASQFRQHFIGFQMYANDWGGHLLPSVPFNSYSNTDPVGSWKHWAFRYQHAKYMNRPHPMFGNGQPDATTTRRDKMFLCPQAVLVPDTSTRSNAPPADLPWDSMYITWAASAEPLKNPPEDQSNANRPDAVFHTRKFQQMRLPYQIVLEADGGIGNPYRTLLGPPTHPNEPIRFRHMDTANLLMADGHIESISRKQGLAQASNNAKVFLIEGWLPYK